MVVCRIFEKRGPGHQMAAQYGAPVAEEESEEERVEEHVKEKGVNEEVRDSAANYVQLTDLHVNLDENHEVVTNSSGEGSSQQDLHVCSQNHEDADIFYGLDGIDNAVNLSQQLDQFAHVANGFFEMNDFDASLLEVPPSQGLNISTDGEVLNEGVQFFDSVDRFDDIDGIFNYEGFAEDDKFLFDEVNMSFGGDSLGSFCNSNDILQNHDGINTEEAIELAGSTLCQSDAPKKDVGPSVQDGLSMPNLNSIGNEELLDMQAAVPSPVRYSPISESLIRFLDSFSPPPAFASEFVPANFNLVPETIGFISTTSSKSKQTKVKSVVSRVLRGILCSFFFLAIAVTAGCKLAICVGAK